MPGREPQRTQGFRSYAAVFTNASYLRTVAGYAAYTFALGGIAVWMPTFLIRIRGVPRRHGKHAARRRARRDRIRRHIWRRLAGDALRRKIYEPELWVSGIATLLGAPLAYVALTAADPHIYWAALVAAEILLFISTGPINAAIVSEVPPAARAAAAGGSILAIHVLGDVPSPWIIGAMSDRSSLATAVLIIPVAIVIAGAIWVIAAWYGKRVS